ncbi:MAG: DUF6580 family putative transport protein [Candidatus Uhrbacteria bacterium]
MSNHLKIITAIFLIALSVVFRLAPHPANFAPVAAAAAVAAIYLGRRWAVVIPLLIMVISDCFIGFYSAPIMLMVYGAFVLIGLGNSITKQKDLTAVFVRSILGSVFFFLVTNWAVWQFSFLYQKNLSGLFQSYMMAVPFFRNTLLGDLTFIFGFVGAIELFYLLSQSRNKNITENEAIY